MNQLALLAVAALAIAALNAAPASAQANRTFVSGFGSDSSNCSFQNPCRTFTAALAVTNPKGEIAVLDPADYGVVTIGKAVSIVNDGVGVASITNTVGGTAAISIAAGASDVVNLRGLTLTGAGVGNSTQGIVFTSGAGLNIQNCVIRDFGANGLVFGPTQSSTLSVLDTIVSGIGGSTGAVLLDPSGSSLTVTVYLQRLQVSGNAQHGVIANSQGMTGGSLNVTVADSNLTDNPIGSGMLAPTLSGPTITLINTRMTNNDIGLNLGGGTAYIAETVITGNRTNGFLQRPGATIASFGNNRITDTNNSGSLSPIAKQ